MQLTQPPALPSYSLLWDESALLDSRAKDFLQSGIADTESEAFEMASLDHECLEWEFEDFLEHLDSFLGRISPDRIFHIEGRNLGWRHRSGSLHIEALDARSFIGNVFPKTEWRMEGHFDERNLTLLVHLYHHDAPTGELYIIMKGGG